MLRTIPALCLVAGVSVSVTGVAAASPLSADTAARLLIPHRAVYDLKLKNASAGSGIEGMFGRMVYEFNGSACTGFTTNFRLVTKISTGEETRVSDQQTKTFEDLSAGQFHFETKSFTDEQPDKDIAGDASQGEGGVKVELQGQNRQEIELPASDFPTTHMLDIIRNAKEDKRIFETRVFDGSENGDQSLLTSTVIGKAETPEKGDADAGNAGEFAQTQY